MSLDVDLHDRLDSRNDADTDHLRKIFVPEDSKDGFDFLYQAFLELFCCNGGACKFVGLNAEEDDAKVYYV